MYLFVGSSFLLPPPTRTFHESRHVILVTAGSSEPITVPGTEACHYRAKKPVRHIEIRTPRMAQCRPVSGGFSLLDG